MVLSQGEVTLATRRMQQTFGSSAEKFDALAGEERRHRRNSFRESEGRHIDASPPNTGVRP